MKCLKFFILAIIVGGSFLTTDLNAQYRPANVVFVAPPPMVQIGLEIFLETNYLTELHSLYFTGYYMNLSGWYHTGYNKSNFSPVIFQAVCRSSNGNYWFVCFDALGNFLFAMEGSNVIPE